MSLPSSKSASVFHTSKHPRRRLVLPAVAVAALAVGVAGCGGGGSGAKTTHGKTPSASPHKKPTQQGGSY